ncbi:9879_t:CDS:2 [Ambispora gerdemannii]|uniref:9879_t:CDS:1 n=1 Tax=Ambispora gerdemannii TaxID=144530 RepID=A0A9N8WGN2_9GLOM|nr:9879_t:CDS:2 [Ambispora gerdemannii]
MTAPEACCTVPPVKSNYESKGEYIQITDDLKAYTIGPKNAKNAVIIVYDIFGYHPNAFQTADILAEQLGFRVVIPDIFRGKPYTVDQLIRDEGYEKLAIWLNEVAPDQSVLNQIDAVVNHLRKDGAEDFGYIGYCWGGKFAFLVAKQETFTAAVGIHPSFTTEEHKIGIKIPIALLPSRDEPDFAPFIESLKKEPFGQKSIHHRFDDMPHGFAAARGDWSVSLTAQRAQEAIQLAANFLKENVGVRYK